MLLGSDDFNELHKQDVNKYFISHSQKVKFGYVWRQYGMSPFEIEMEIEIIPWMKGMILLP
jgi:hypothetical protein